MTNHLHLLVTPADKGQLTKFMQSMANRYVRYFNAKHQRTGTLWEGRYKSCLVDSDQYLFSLYKYIEMNPIRAGMVKNIVDYKWSSYRHNALGQMDSLVAEHPLYKDLGENVEQRSENYRKIFSDLNSTEKETQITEATMRGEVYGSDKFHSKISQLIVRSTKLASHGGDRKSEEYKNQVG